jgi:hypothetical protein
VQHDVVSGDLDGDGRSDIVASGYHELAVILGRGAGRFAPPVVLATYQELDYVVGAAITDLDGDGDLDIGAIVSKTSLIDPVSTYFNLGDGTFAREQADIPACELAQTIEGGDLDGDGDADLIAAGYTGQIVPLVNSGAGFLAPSRIWTAVGDVRDLEVLDVERDGDLDLIAAVFPARQLAVYINEGGGNLAQPLPLMVEGEPRGVVASDIDGDGERDLLTAHGTGFSVLVNQGNGGFDSPRVTSAEGRGFLGLAAGDLDGDGDSDVGTVDGSETVSVHLNDGELPFRERIVFPPNVSASPTYGATPRLIDSGDYDGDGRADLVLGYSAGSALSLYLGFREAPADCNGNAIDDSCDTAIVLSTGSPERLGQALDAPSALAHSDLDGDGDTDLLVADTGTDRVLVLANDGAGGFDGVQTLVGGLDPLSLETVDFDRDGALDVLSVNNGSDSVSVFLNRGDGALIAPLDIPVPRSYPVGVGAADLDGDGLSDIVTVSQASAAVSMSFAEGDGTFQVVEVTVGEWPQAVATGDLDGDGLIDVVASTRYTPYLFVVANRGDRRFSRRSNLRVGGGTTRIACVDIDRDGDLDLLCDARLNSIAVLMNQGDGRFDAARQYAAGVDPVAVIPADLGDELPAIIAIAQGRISVLRSLDDDFLPEIRVDVPEPATAGAAVDVDGDSIVDFLWTDGSSIVVLQGAAPTASSADCDSNGIPDECEAGCGPAVVQFLRADANADGRTDMSDPLLSLRFLFEEGVPEPVCMDSLDSNDDGRVDISDALNTLGFLFLSLPLALAEPSGACGPDASEDSLGCAAYPACEG